MKTARRAPVEPTPEIARALKSAAKHNKVCVLDGVSIYPPSKARPTWRIQGTLHGKAIPPRASAHAQRCYRCPCWFRGRLAAAVEVGFDLRAEPSALTLDEVDGSGEVRPAGQLQR